MPINPLRPLRRYHRPMDLRSCPVLLLSLSVGCYSPTNAASTGDGADDEASSDSTDALTTGPGTTLSTSSPTTATTDTDAADTTLDATTADGTAGDAPPELSNFSVNGSESPSEILEADMVEIQVAAMDDVGIDRVEFYDGDELIATFTEPPYRTEFLVTSTENGGHSYTAVAYDTSEQSAEAGPIPLSVSIDGGAVLELREDIFRSRTGFSLFGTPKLSIDDDRVFVSGTSQYVGTGFTKGRWTTMRYSTELGLLWEEAYPSSMSSGSPNRTTTSPVRANADAAWLATASIEDNEQTFALFPHSLEDGGVSSPTAIDGTGAGAYPLRGLAVDSTGALYAAGPAGSLAKFEEGVAEPVWTIDALEGQAEGSFVVGVSVSADDDALIDISCFVGACGEDTALRKISSDGDILWTRDGAFISIGLTDGTSVSVRGAETTTGVQLWHRDGDGNELVSVQIDELIVFASDLAATPDGDVVIAGRRGTGPNIPVVARVTAAGDLVWMTEPDVGDGETAIASGVAISGDGRLYVTGTANAEVDGVFGNDIGDAWVAELAL